MADTSIELKWLPDMLHDMNVLIPLHIPLYCDNTNVIFIVTNIVFYERTKHIEVNCHVTSLEYTVKKIVLFYISFKKQVGDVFTKALSVPLFHNFLFKLPVFVIP